MPRNTGTNIYAIPPDTEGIPDQTIESATYNTYIHDVEKDLNDPRPIIAGGTGANDADEALFNLGGERSTQLVTNYDTHVWMPGSFRAAGSATAGPVDGHAFAGIVYLNENYLNPPTNANVIVSARDMNDTVVPSRVYVREKKANVWGAWTVIDATTLPFPPGGGLSPTTILTAIQELEAEKATIVYVDSEITDLQNLAQSLYSPIISPTFTGDPKAPTPPFGDNDTSIATTAFVRTEFAPIASPIFTGDARSPTPLVNDNDTSIATTAFVSQAVANGLAAGGGSINALSYSGLQVNGSMDVSQERGTTTVGATGHLLDCWSLTANLGGGVVAFGQATGTTFFPGFPNILLGSVTTIQTVLNTSNEVSVSTRIEGYRIARLAWGTANARPITIGFWSAHSPGGPSTYSVSIRNGADNRTYVTTYSQAATDIPQYNVITIPGDTTGTWATDKNAGLVITFTMAAFGSLQTSSTNQWLAGNFIAATGQVNGMVSTINRFRLGGVVVLPGIISIPVDSSALITRPYDQELAMCQRYLQMPFASYSGYAFTTTHIRFGMAFPIPMREGPVLTPGNMSLIDIHTAGLSTNGLNMGTEFTGTGGMRAYVITSAGTFTIGDGATVTMQPGACVITARLPFIQPS